MTPSWSFWAAHPRKAFWALRTAADRVVESTLAARTPAWYAQRIRARRGREVRPDEAADYALAVAGDYEAVARAAGVCATREAFWQGVRVLELGPGDNRAVGLVARARGAAEYVAIDAYDIESRDEEKNRAIYERVLDHEGRPRDAWRTLLGGAGVCPSPEALEGPPRRFDRVISRAVLEHVSDLPGLFASLAPWLAPDAVCVHKADLRSHGMQLDNELDFLLFPDAIYRHMAGRLDLPNRVRPADYLALGRDHGLRLAHASVTHRVAEERVQALREHLPPRFAERPDGELRVQGLWLVYVGASHPCATVTADAADLPDAPIEGVSRY